MTVFRVALTLILTVASLSAAASASVPPSTAASPGVTPAAAATNPPPAEDPRVTAQVKAQFLAWQSGKIDRSQYTAEASSKLTDPIVKDVSGQLSAFGAPTKFTLLDKSVVQGNSVYTYGVDTAKAKLQMLFAVGPDNKISGIFFRPAP